MVYRKWLNVLTHWGHSLNYHYDGERNLVGLTNEKGENYLLRYDLNERLIEEVGFDGRIQKYHYNAAGHLIASDDVQRKRKKICLGVCIISVIRAGRLIKQYGTGFTRCQ